MTQSVPVSPNFSYFLAGDMIRERPILKPSAKHEPSFSQILNAQSFNQNAHYIFVYPNKRSKLNIGCSHLF